VPEATLQRIDIIAALAGDRAVLEEVDGVSVAEVMEAQLRSNQQKVSTTFSPKILEQP
jgi:hypothetical protein